MLQYIYHSCFVWEDADFLLVYDYWKDPEERLRSMLDGAGEREVYFVVSHFHEDHFNAEMVEACALHEHWHLLPSYDTVKRRRIDATLPLAVLRFGETVETPYFRLKAYRSTDVGVCTIVELRDGMVLFHAGDCNNWYFSEADRDHLKVPVDQMEKLYLSILRDIKSDYPRIDHAMFPVDSRLGQEMLRGVLQLMNSVEVKSLHPMHYAAAIS